MNYIDEKFGSAFIILDFASKEITHKTLRDKIEILKIVSKAIDTQLREHEQTLKYREDVYKDFVKRG